MDSAGGNGQRQVQGIVRTRAVASLFGQLARDVATEWTRHSSRLPKDTAAPRRS